MIILIPAAVIIILMIPQIIAPLIYWGGIAFQARVPKRSRNSGLSPGFTPPQLRKALAY